MNGIFDQLVKDTTHINKLEIINIMDRSGSMADLRAEIIGGFNTFMAEQRQLPGQARVTLVQFNSDVDTLYEGVNIAHLGNLTQATYIPFGGTALYDALVSTLQKQAARIAREAWADKVLVNIITDGKDLNSRLYTKAQTKELIQQLQDEQKWGFLFQAANQDAFETGSGFGISASTTRNFTANAAGVAEAYNTMSMYATNLRSGL